MTTAMLFWRQTWWWSSATMLYDERLTVNLSCSFEQPRLATRNNKPLTNASFIADEHWYDWRQRDDVTTAAANGMWR